MASSSFKPLPLPMDSAYTPSDSVPPTTGCQSAHKSAGTRREHTKKLHDPQQHTTTDRAARRVSARNIETVRKGVERERVGAPLGAAEDTEGVCTHRHIEVDHGKEGHTKHAQSKEGI